MPMIKGRPVSDEMMIEEVRTRMRCMGYRPVIESDLQPGQELVMVEVERFYLDGGGLPPIGCAGTTVIKLDDPAIAPSVRQRDVMYVFFHCISPKWDSDCFVGKKEFLYDDYVSAMMANDTRWFAKSR